MDDKYLKLKQTIVKIPDQLQQSWDEIKTIKFPSNYLNLKKVVFCGMGGSSLGARIADAYLINAIRVPFEIFNGYHLPNYCDSDTLVVCDSYSGNTEEVISCMQDALVRDLKIVVITSGGKLAQIANEYKLPMHILNPVNNPSDQPRNALGYSVGSVLGVLSSLGLASIDDGNISQACDLMHNMALELFSDQGKALYLAENLNKKAIMLITAAHLYGPAFVFKNQINETAKVFSSIFEIPELNHHLMEGLQFPKDLNKQMVFLLVKSPDYFERIKFRFDITKDVIAKNGYEVFEYETTSKGKLNQIFEVLMFGAAVVYYLAFLNKVDPNKIPWVDYFKERLEKF